MKKTIALLALFCATIHCSEKTITLITYEQAVSNMVDTFNSMGENEKIEALAKIDGLSGWITKTFHRQSLATTTLVIVAKRIGFLALMPKVKEYCKNKLDPVVKRYIEYCETNNKPMCTVEINQHNIESLTWCDIIGDDEECKLIQEYTTREHIEPLYIVSSIHNELRSGELEKILR